MTDIGAGSAGDNGFRAVEDFVVDVVHHGFHVVAARRGNYDFLGTCLDVLLGFFLGSEEAGALQHHIHAQLAPRQLLGIGIGEHFDFLAVDNQIVAFQLGAAIEAALGGVVFEEMQQHVGGGEVVDGNHFHALGLVHLAQGKTADAAKTVDCNFDTHGITPLLWETAANHTTFRLLLLSVCWCFPCLYV